MVIGKGAKLTFKISVKSAKICRVSGNSLKGLKGGSCVVTLTVKPLKGVTATKTVNIKVLK
jgi:hypothetical protein